MRTSSDSASRGSKRVQIRGCHSHGGWGGGAWKVWCSRGARSQCWLVSRAMHTPCSLLAFPGHYSHRNGFYLFCLSQPRSHSLSSSTTTSSTTRRPATTTTSSFIPKTRPKATRRVSVLYQELQISATGFLRTPPSTRSNLVLSYTALGTRLSLLSAPEDALYPSPGDIHSRD